MADSNGLLIRVNQKSLKACCSGDHRKPGGLVILSPEPGARSPSARPPRAPAASRPNSGPSCLSPTAPLRPGDGLARSAVSSFQLLLIPILLSEAPESSTRVGRWKVPAENARQGPQPAASRLCGRIPGPRDPRRRTAHARLRGEARALPLAAAFREREGGPRGGGHRPEGGGGAAARAHGAAPAREPRGRRVRGRAG